MLNPESNNYRVTFDKSFWNKDLISKYDEYLYNLNAPVKNLEDHIHENIQGVTIPGLNNAVNEINGMKNFNNPNDLGQKTTDFVFIKNQSLMEMFEINKINIISKNTIINWTYFYEFFRAYAQRGSGKKINVSDFSIRVLVRNAADIPVLHFTFRKCFSASLPSLDFNQAASFSETKTIDVGFWFNEMDVKFIIPPHNITKNVR